MEKQKYIIAEGDEPIPCEMYISLLVFSDEHDFNPSVLTQILQIEPTTTWHKGDLIRKDLYRKETSWWLKTPCIKTFEFEEVFQILMSILDGKADILGKYAKDNNLFVKIIPVIVVSNNQPCIIISKEIAEILLLLSATMEFDIHFN